MVIRHSSHTIVVFQKCQRSVGNVWYKSNTVSSGKCVAKYSTVWQFNRSLVCFHELRLVHCVTGTIYFNDAVAVFIVRMPEPFASVENKSLLGKTFRASLVLSFYFEWNGRTYYVQFNSARKKNACYL